MNTVYQTSAGGIVFKRIDKKTLWLICKHSQHKGWVFPKGLVGDHNLGEKKESAALREVKEEGGVKTKIINPNPIITRYEYPWEKDFIKKTVYYYLMEYVSGNPKDHDWEMSDAKFVDEETVKKMLTYPSDKEAFKKIIKIFKEK